MPSIFSSLVMKYVDDAVIRLENQKKDGIVNEKDDNSVLHKLLKINKDYAVLMSFDMLFAGIDTVSLIFKICFRVITKIY